MKPSMLTLVLISLFLMPKDNSFAGNSIAVITNPKSEINTLTPIQIKSFFLLESQLLESGTLVEIGDRDRNSLIFKEFYQSVAAMTPKEVAIHWARKVFTGKAVAPKPIKGDDDAAKAWVKSKVNGITFIESKHADNSVKIIGTVTPDAVESR